MKELAPQENILIGKIIFDGKSAKKDETYLRITWLKNSYLKEVATDESGWEVLYQDPKDNRYWKLTFPESEEHGGGAPILKNISFEQAKSKFTF